MPRIGGRLVAVGGDGVGLDGKPAAGVTVHAMSIPTQPPPEDIPIRPRRAGAAQAPEPPTFPAERKISSRPRQTDAAGRFVLEGVPAGWSLWLYALSEDGSSGAWVATKLTEDGRPARPIRLALRPTVRVELALVDEQNIPIPAGEFIITPKPGADLVSLKRTVKSDEKGLLHLDGIIPGLTYHIKEDPAVLERLPGGAFVQEKPVLDKDMILAPE